MKKAVLLASCLAAVLLLASTSEWQAQPKSPPTNNEPKGQLPLNPQVNSEIENIRLQQERLDFDREKFKTETNREERKLDVEKSKAIWSAIATAVPLLVGVIAIIAGFLNQHRQIKHQFELKAAEIVFTGTTPQAVLNRGRALRAIFGDYLSKDFLNNFKPEDYGGYKEPWEEKRFFLEQVLKDSTKKGEIIRLWFHLFPGDFRWLIRVDPDQFKDIDIPEIKELLNKTSAYQKKEKVLPEKA